MLSRHSLWCWSPRRQRGVCHEPAKALANRLGRHTGHRLAGSFRDALELDGERLRKRDLQSPAQRVTRFSSRRPMECAFRTAAMCFLCLTRLARPTDWPTYGPNRTPVHLVCPHPSCHGRHSTERSAMNQGKTVRERRFPAEVCRDWRRSSDRCSVVQSGRSMVAGP